MRILVADDNLASRELMRELLQASGHSVVEATNGHEALDLIHQDPPDLVFLDLQMPVLDGFSVVRQLRSDERFRRLPAAVRRWPGWGISSMACWWLVRRWWPSSTL